MYKYIILFFLIAGCSFDDKTGIWTGDGKKITKNNQNESLKPIFEKQKGYLKEINLINNKILNFENKKENLNWKQKYSNNSNNFGNVNFKNIGEYKKLAKISKNSINEDIFFYKGNLIYSDSKGNIGLHSLSENRKISNFNFYQKKFKRIKKKLNIILDDNFIYVSDNLGYVYCLDIEKNNIIWAKNFRIPFRSNIKIFKNTLFLVDEKNKIILIDISNGNKIDELYTQPAKAVSSFENNLALDRNGNLLMLNTNGNLYSVNFISNKVINWVRNFNTEDQVVFNAMPLLTYNDKILITTDNKISLYTDTGLRIWDLNLSAEIAPVKSGNSIFMINEDNYLIIINEKNGEIIFSKKIYNILRDSSKKKLSNKIKKIRYLFISYKKLILISDNSFFLEIDLNNKMNISSIRKKPFFVGSDIISIKDQLILISKKNRLYQLF